MTWQRPVVLATFMVLAATSAALAQNWTLSDEFNDAATTSNWSRFHDVGDWPDKAVTADINTTSPGNLYIRPSSCGWYNDLHAPTFFKTLTGDFVVETRVRADGTTTPIPTQPYSLAGIFIRTPRAVSKATWVAGQENWMFFSVGMGDTPNTYTFERKTTTLSNSQLVLTPITDSGLQPVTSGWIRLRITRTGADFTLEYQVPGDIWQTHWVFTRNDMPATLDVGVTAYSDWPTISPYVSDPLTGNCDVFTVNNDLEAHFDYVRYGNLATGIESPGARVQLDQNFPNPFNPTTTIRYWISVAGPVKLNVYDASGALVRTLVDGVVNPNAGGNTVIWNGRNNVGATVTSGVYFYRLEAAGVIRTQKLVLLK